MKDRDADAALRQSLQLQPSDNVSAFIGMAALACMPRNGACNPQDTLLEATDPDNNDAAIEPR